MHDTACLLARPLLCVYYLLRSDPKGTVLSQPKKVCLLFIKKRVDTIIIYIQVIICVPFYITGMFPDDYLNVIAQVCNELIDIHQSMFRTFNPNLSTATCI